MTVAGIRVPRDGGERVRRDRRRRRRQDRRVPGEAGRPARPARQPGRVVRVDGQLRLHHRGAARRAARRTPSDETSVHDMGGSIIPMLVASGAAHVYDFADNDVPGADRARPRLLARRRDHRRLLRRAHGPGRGAPGLQPLQPQWPIFTNHPQLPPAKFVEGGLAQESIVGAGAIVSGATVRHSRALAGRHASCSRRVRRGLGAAWTACGSARGAVVRRAILDKNVVVPGRRAHRRRPGAGPAALPRQRRRRRRARQGRAGPAVTAGRGALIPAERLALRRHDVVTYAAGSAGSWPRVPANPPPEEAPGEAPSRVRRRRVAVALAAAGCANNSEVQLRRRPPRPSGSAGFSHGLREEGRRAGRPGRQQDLLRRQARRRHRPDVRAQRVQAEAARSSASTSTSATRSRRSSA